MDTIPYGRLAALTEQASYDPRTPQSKHAENFPPTVQNLAACILDLRGYVKDAAYGQRELSREGVRDYLNSSLREADRNLESYRFLMPHPAYENTHTISREAYRPPERIPTNPAAENDLLVCTIFETANSFTDLPEFLDSTRGLESMLRTANERADSLYTREGTEQRFLDLLRRYTNLRAMCGEIMKSHNLLRFDYESPDAIDRDIARIESRRTKELSNPFSSRHLARVSTDLDDREPISSSAYEPAR